LARREPGGKDGRMSCRRAAGPMSQREGTAVCTRCDAGWLRARKRRSWARCDEMLAKDDLAPRLDTTRSAPHRCYMNGNSGLKVRCTCGGSEASWRTSTRVCPRVSGRLRPGRRWLLCRRRIYGPTRTHNTIEVATNGEVKDAEACCGVPVCERCKMRRLPYPWRACQAVSRQPRPLVFRVRRAAGHRRVGGVGGQTQGRAASQG
jgi:hypothetical protein